MMGKEITNPIVTDFAFLIEGSSIALQTSEFRIFQWLFSLSGFDLANESNTNPNIPSPASLKTLQKA